PPTPASPLSLHDALPISRLVNLYTQLLDRIQALPGVRAATLIENAPFSGWSSKNSSVSVEGSAQNPSNSEMYWQGVGPDFFSTIDRKSTRLNSSHVAISY